MVKKTFGIILLVIGFICVVSYIDDANNGRNKDRAMSVVMAGLFLLGGAALLRSARSDAAQTEASAKARNTAPRWPMAANCPTARGFCAPRTNWAVASRSPRLQPTPRLKYLTSKGNSTRWPEKISANSKSAKKG